MKEIIISKGQVALVDDEDFEYLNQWKWFYYPNGYVGRNSKSVMGKRHVILMHREIMNTPKNMVTDHINHNKLDNRKENLRVCTKSQNQHNRVRNTGVPYKGVSIQYGKYIFAAITHKNKSINLGSFPSIEDAARAYDKKAKQLFGEFALLNFPEEQTC